MHTVCGRVDSVVPNHGAGAVTCRPDFCSSSVGCWVNQHTGVGSDLQRQKCLLLNLNVAFGVYGDILTPVHGCVSFLPKPERSARPYWNDERDRRWVSLAYPCALACVISMSYIRWHHVAGQSDVHVWAMCRCAHSSVVLRDVSSLQFSRRTAGVRELWEACRFLPTPDVTPPHSGGR